MVERREVGSEIMPSSGLEGDEGPPEVSLTDRGRVADVTFHLAGSGPWSCFRSPACAVTVGAAAT
jgi:hypothetical protein